jgi:hypothetical protein
MYLSLDKWTVARHEKTLKHFREVVLPKLGGPVGPCLETLSELVAITVGPVAARHAGLSEPDPFVGFIEGCARVYRAGDPRRAFSADRTVTAQDIVDAAAKARAGIDPAAATGLAREICNAGRRARNEPELP